MDRPKDSRKHDFVIGGIFRAEPIEIGVTIDVHSVRGFALDVKFEAIMHLTERELRAFGIHLVLIHSKSGERRDRVQNLRRFAEGGGIFANPLFPGLAIDFDFDARAHGYMRLFAREIRGVAFGGLYLDLLAGFYFYQRFGGGAILAVRFAPDFTAQHRDVVIDNNAGSGTGPAGLPVGDLVRVVELIRSHTGLDLEPARARFGAGQQRTV
jgi:hypothetical protein